MGKLVKGEREALTIAGEMARLKMKNPIAEDAISSVSALIFELQKFGMEMSQNIGPTVLDLVKTLGYFIETIDKTIGVGNIMIVMLATMAGKMVYTAAAGAVNMAVQLGLMTAKMGASSFGIGIPIGLALAAGTMAAVAGFAAKGKAMAKSAKLAEGGIIPASPGGTLATIGEGGQAEAVIPLDKIDKQNAEQNKRLKKLEDKLEETLQLFTLSFNPIQGTLAMQIANGVSNALDRRQ